ncbi:MSCRAMM family protein [Amedibacillus sp. YH-ame10]
MKETIKNRFQKLLLVFIAMLSVCTSFNLPTKIAAASPNITAGAYTGYSVNVMNSDGVHSEWNANYQAILIDGEYGFCVQPGYVLAPGNDFTPSAYDKESLSIIAYEGWVRSNHTMEDYLATQFMIWESLGGKITSTSFSAYASYKSTIQNKINKHSLLPKFNTNDLELNVGESITITDINGVFEQFNLVNDGGLQLSKNGNSLTITAKLSTPENATILYNKIPDNCVGTSIVYKKPGSQDAARLYVSDPIPTNIKVKVNKFGSLSITKLDDLGNNVPNTSFKLSKNADMSDPVGTYTTGANGIVVVDQLLPATYYVQEVSVPGHLILDSTIRSIEVKPNETSYFTANNNWKRGYIQVVKKDKDSGKTVVKANTTFSIYKSNGTYVQDITTNNDGSAKTGLLLYGDYYLLEKTAPDGYIITYDKLVYTISEDGKTYSQEITNKRVTGTINIKKEDGVTGSVPQGEATLQGAVYELKARKSILDPADGSVKYAKDSVVDTLITDKNAQASVFNLYLGEYYLKEKTPSEGYTLDPTEYDVTLSYENQNVSVITKNQTVKEKVISQAFELIKVSDNGSGEADLLAGVEFTVKSKKDIDDYGSWEKAPIAKNALGKTTAVLVTDKKGYAVSEELPYGDYVVRETKVQADHSKVPDFHIKIDKDSRTPQVWRVFNDVKFRAVVSIVKKDADSDKIITLSGAKFKIKNLDKDEYVGHWVWNPLPHYVDSWTTDKNGSVMTDDVLDPGNYQLEEVESPNGFLLAKPIKFKISSSGVFETLPDGTTPVITVVVRDNKPTGKVKLSKVDKETREVLSGVQYQLTAAADVLDPADGSIIYKEGSTISMDISENGYYLTNELGEIEIEGLPLGTYACKETKALDGYVKDETTYIFELTQENNTQEVYVHELTLENQKTKTEILKYDINNHALENAHLRLVDEDGEIVKEWVSKKGPMKLEGLLVGKEYTLYEDEAPEWYVISRPVTFTVDNTTKVQEIKMFDKQVGVSKLDEEKKHLEGAKLQVVSAKTKDIVDEWESDGKEHMIRGLIEGNRYILKEIEAPLGYEKAKDIEFTVNEDKEIQKLVMVDVPIREKIYIKKIDGDTKESIKMKEFEFTLYKDEGCTQRLRSVEADQEHGVVELELRYGEYWVKESKAPKGYQLSSDVLHIKIDENGVFLNGKKLVKEGDLYEILFENFKVIQPVVKTGDVHDDLQRGVFVMALGVSFYGILFSLKRLRKDIR